MWNIFHSKNVIIFYLTFKEEEEEEKTKLKSNFSESRINSRRFIKRIRRYAFIGILSNNHWFYYHSLFPSAAKENLLNYHLQTWKGRKGKNESFLVTLISTIISQEIFYTKYILDVSSECNKERARKPINEIKFISEMRVENINDW